MRTKNKTSISDNIFYTLCEVLVIFLTILVLYPVIYVISASFSSGQAILSGRVWLWPVDFSLDGYKAVLNYKNIWIGYRNTVFYTVVGTCINLCVTLMCAYPMARKKLRGRKYIMYFFSFTMIFSGGMIPAYINIRNLGIMNTVWAMLLPGTMSVYNMIVARTFIQSNIPEELFDAGKIDGCDDFHFFFKVVLPLSKSVIAVLTMWYAVSHWNQYFNAFLYLSDKKLYPLQIFLKDVLVQNQISADMLGEEMTVELQTLNAVLKYAMIVVATAPLFCVYPFIQKHFQKGVMVGSVKG